MSTMKLYYHKTDGGAEYLTDKFVVCPDGSKEGVIEGALYVVRIDGDITKDAELSGRACNSYDALLAACKMALLSEIDCAGLPDSALAELLKDTIAAAEGE